MSNYLPKIIFMYRDFGTVLVAVILGIIMVAVPLIVQSLVAPSKKTKEKLETYECGEVSEGSAWLQFNIRFYVIALIFLIFDVEVVFLFPWAVVFKDLGLLAMVEMTIFLLILIVGLAYVWIKSDLDWVKRKVKYASGRYAKIQLKDNA
jgi:NADH-quinone oxidoreductase subunit A